MKPNPRVRRDGLCYRCRAERAPLAVKYGDPFCTATCCRTFHGVRLSSPERDEKGKVHSKDHPWRRATVK